VDHSTTQKYGPFIETSLRKNLEKIYPVSLSLLPRQYLKDISTAFGAAFRLEELPGLLEKRAGSSGIPEFLPDLARLELAFYETTLCDVDMPEEIEAPDTNPTLRILKLSWKGLGSLLSEEKDAPIMKGREMVMVWKDGRSSEVRTKSASDEDLLVLKIVVEGLEAEEIAGAGNVPISAVEDAIDRAAEEGIIYKPQSIIRRDAQVSAVSAGVFDQFLSASIFTLQWHLTQACDLHCRHCYDRSDRDQMSFEESLRVLEDFRSFCKSRHVRGQISFSGGNPFLYPRFTELYRAAAGRGFTLAVLGNPSQKEILEELVAIQKPSFFQVSLEGLEEHNDYMRGKGHFNRVMDFLRVLRELGIYSMVMLTLTKKNIGQVIPLAERLQGLADTFNFNRLSMVGEAAGLGLPSKEEFMTFLEAYLKAAEDNPVMGIKDNLINIMNYKHGKEYFGGCTGFGCGAAFNFISLLPEGEAHACRKFPSPIGNILKDGIAGVYDSEAAKKYRAGCDSCKSCAVRPVCGGCLAVSYSHGLNIFEDRDPFCFIEREIKKA
jgi:selenobiotic family peptide radical SAM maturase